MNRHPFLALLAAPTVRRLALGGGIGRLREAGTGLAIVLAARAATGSYASAGGAVGVYLLAAALGRPFHGRLVDRRGPRVLLWPSAINGAILAGLAVAVALGARDTIILAGAVLTGASLPAISATLRASWPRVVPGEVERAYAFDTLLYELSLVLSPTLVALLAAAASPAAALGFVAVAGTVGTAIVALVAPREPASSAPAPAVPRPAPAVQTANPPGRPARLTSPVVLALIAVSAFTGLAEGSLTVIVPAFASAHGGGALSGLLLSALSLGSLAGALAIGLVPARVAWQVRLPATSAGLVGAFVLLAVARPGPAGFAVLAALVGLALAPTLTTGFLALQRTAPARALTEAFTWASFAAAAAAGGGQALAGRLVAAHGVATALWEPAVAAACALALAIALGAASRTTAPPRRDHH